MSDRSHRKRDQKLSAISDTGDRFLIARMPPRKATIGRVELSLSRAQLVADIIGDSDHKSARCRRMPDCKAAHMLCMQIKEVSRQHRCALAAVQAELAVANRRITSTRNVVVNLAEHDIPTLFSITAEPDSTSGAGVAEGIIHWALGRGLPPWAKKIRGLFKVQLRVQLLCMRTLRVAACGDDGEGYKIARPGEIIPRLAPLLRLGVKAATVIAGAATVARVFGCAISGPTPEAIAGWKATAEWAGSDQSHLSSKSVQLTGAAKREFRKFLQEVDPEEHYGGLQRRVNRCYQSLVHHAHALPRTCFKNGWCSSSLELIIYISRVSCCNRLQQINVYTTSFLIALLVKFCAFVLQNNQLEHISSQIW